LKKSTMEKMITEEMNDMETLIVTRHPGAVDFIQHCGFAGEVCEHFVPGMAHEGMLIIGVLPVHLIAQVLQTGAHFIQVVLPQIPPEMRGVDLTPAQMVEFGAQLIEITGIQTRVV